MLIMRGHDETFNALSEPLDVCGSGPTMLDDSLFKSFPESARAGLYCFYVDNWNSCIYVAAAAARLAWAPGPIGTY